jgi:ABC-2 type transport system permease protein/lipopolysaccharide transport system permease protein
MRIQDRSALQQKLELLILLVEKDLKTRYRRSFLGLLWTLINPMISSLILWIVFVSIFKSKLASGTQFAPFLLAGVLTITFFNQGLIQAAESISNGAGLFLKVKVDARLFALASVLSNAVNFFIGIIALVLVTFTSGSTISATFPLVLLVGLSLIPLITGVGLVFGNLFIRFDDTKYIVTILLQLLTYLTPVFYPKEILTGWVKIIVEINPLTSYLDVFRHVVNGTEVATYFDWAYMFASAFASIILGFLIFKNQWSKNVVMM